MPFASVSFLPEEEFQQLQQSFMEKHYLQFEDSEENKLSYTPIFNEYVSSLHLTAVRWNKAVTSMTSFPDI